MNHRPSNDKTGRDIIFHNLCQELMETRKRGSVGIFAYRGADVESGWQDMTPSSHAHDYCENTNPSSTQSTVEITIRCRCGGDACSTRHNYLPFMDVSGLNPNRELEVG
jgi:hypothetical protein